MSAALYASAIGANIFALFLGYLFIRGYTVKYGTQTLEEERDERIESEFYNEQYEKTVQNYAKLNPLGQKIAKIIDVLSLNELSDESLWQTIYQKGQKLWKLRHSSSDIRQTSVAKEFDEYKENYKTFYKFRLSSNMEKAALTVIDIIDAMKNIEKDLYELFYINYFDTKEDFVKTLDSSKAELVKLLKLKHAIDKKAREDAAFEIEYDIVQ